jgi:hypothetical protein
MGGERVDAELREGRADKYGQRDIDHGGWQRHAE